MTDPDDPAAPRRFLVIGRAKTGTTALVSLLKQSLDPCHLVMEPKSILDFGPSSRDWQGNEAIKILYEHFRGRWRHLDAIVHEEFGFPIHKVVFITRDIRDEMVSKLLYHAKIVHDDGLLGTASDAQLRAWVAVLEAKERDPERYSFHDLCLQFHELTGIDLWQRITDLAEVSAFHRYVQEGVQRDRHVISYERFVSGELDELAGYLGRPVPAIADIDLGEFSHTRRSGRFGNWRVFFTDHDVDLLRPLVEEWMPGSDYTDWVLSTDAGPDPAECSQYVARNIASGIAGNRSR